MIQADKTGIAEDAVSVVIPGATLYIPFAELVDIAQEIERLKKEQKRLEGELSRSRGMLSNERFLSKAPEAKIAEEKGKAGKIRADDGTGDKALRAAGMICNENVQNKKNVKHKEYDEIR